MGGINLDEELDEDNPEWENWNDVLDDESKTSLMIDKSFTKK